VKGAPVFMVAAGDGQEGRLVVDRAGERAGSALVAYATGIEEVDAAELRIVRIE
jgi:ParB family chromosome partitioning protein